ncbi:MAG: DUF386 domain-containing protein [Ruminococcaceae bacterium]|nr:DUF386 domain-containing protein [Oscillospiraceae bacterium]
MIFDSLKNSEIYEGIHEKFAEAFAFLEQATKEDLPIGRYELDGQTLYAMVQEYDTKSAREMRFEGHRRYVDIQYIMRGCEAIEVAELSRVEADGAYSEEKDVCFFGDCGSSTRAVLHAGEYGIFFPHDIHKPGLTADGAPSAVKKIVVKVQI